MTTKAQTEQAADDFCKTVSTSHRINADIRVGDEAFSNGVTPAIRKAFLAGAEWLAASRPDGEARPDAMCPSCYQPCGESCVACGVTRTPAAPGPLGDRHNKCSGMFTTPDRQVTFCRLVQGHVGPHWTDWAREGFTWTQDQPVDGEARPQEEHRTALSDLYALVKGECPSLLNEDSGGDARLAIRIEALLAASSGDGTKDT